MKTLIYLVILLVEFNVEAEINPEYYWREYSGVVPADALQGGIDFNGNPTYIAQNGFAEGQFPGTIVKGSKQVRSSHSNNIVEKFTKILCTQKPELYQWIPINIAKLHLLTNCHLVLGGNEGGAILHIGRVQTNAETVIGRIIIPTTHNQGLWVAIPASFTKYLTFEILTFNCDPDYYLKNINATLVN